MNHKLPTFKTERLILNAVELSDVPSYEKYFINYSIISQSSPDVPWPFPEGGVEWFL